jgi:hypothetical protein
MGVAICIYPPSDWDGLRFPALEPERQAFYAIKNKSITQEQYEKLYRENVLSRLDPKQIYNMFEKNVLLCWEIPIFDKNKNIINKGSGFCHRHIVSHWIGENLNIEIKEWQNEKDNTPIKNNPLF